MTSLRHDELLKRFVVLVSALIVCLISRAPVHAQSLSRFQISHPSGVGELFHGGVYTYLDNAGDPVAVESHVRRLAQSGMTHLYAAPTGAPEDIALLCRKYGCYVTNQVGWGYLGDDGVPPAGAAQALGTQIQGLLQYPEYMATSVREEPLDQQAFIDSLYNYYAQIDGYVSAANAPFYLLFDWPGAASKAAAKAFKPIMTGYDRTYLFIWNYDAMSGTNLGLMMNPRRALFQINTYLAEFMPNVSVNQQFPVAVVLGAASPQTRTKQDLAHAYDNDQLDGPNYTRWKQIAALGGTQANQGLKLNSDGSLTSWTWYMPPPNTMSAQTWIAIARGYRGIFSWLSQPTTAAEPGLFDLNGPSHKGSVTQDELSQTIRELQKFGWLINRMRPAATTYLTTSNGSYLPNTYSGSFNVFGYTGKLAVVVNADVATYANSEGDLQPTSIFRIDDTGNVNPADYIPNTQARSIALTNVSGGGTMYDFETGTRIGSADLATTGSINVLPGKGKIVFIGTSADLQTLRAKSGVAPDAITALSGLVPYREQIPANVQVFYPSDPKIDSSNYLLGSQPIPLNKRFRIVVTASSSTGAQLGALYGYAAADGSYPSTQLRSANDGQLLWNRPLSSTPTTFTSEDFTVTSGSVGYAWLYRANQAGTIKIHDAWVEDCSSHRAVPAGGWVSSSFALASGATYQLYVRARNYQFDSPPATLGVQVQEFNSAGTLLTTYSTSPAISGGALSPQAASFRATFARHDSRATTAKIRVFNSNGSGTLILESATVARVP